MWCDAQRRVVERCDAPKRAALPTVTSISPTRLIDQADVTGREATSRQRYCRSRHLFRSHRKRRDYWNGMHNGRFGVDDTDDQDLAQQSLKPADEAAEGPSPDIAALIRIYEFVERATAEAAARQPDHLEIYPAASGLNR